MDNRLTIIDSSVFIAHIYPRDLNHERAVAVMSRLDEIIATEYVVLETVTVLRNKKCNKEALDFLHSFECGGGISIVYSNPMFYNETQALFCKSTFLKLSFVDTSLVILSRDYKVLSFDKELNRAIDKYSKGGFR